MGESWPVRRETFLDSGAVAAILTNPAQFDPTAVLGVAGRDSRNLTIRTLKLGPGEAIAALLPSTASMGFLLDLAPADWRSEWGGLLLLQSEGNRVQGYRPTPGALTLFTADLHPLISLITPQGRPRTSILGFWDQAG